MSVIISLVIVVGIGIVLAALFTKLEIPILKKKQFGQYIREEGPQSHLSKQGTPTMGGLAIYASITLTSIICSIWLNAAILDTIVLVVVGALFGLIGFLDDFIKVAKKHN